MSQKTFDLLADAAESAFDADSIKSPDPPINPPDPLLDQNVKVKDGIVCPHETNGEANGEANGVANGDRIDDPNGDRNGESKDEPEGQTEDEMPPLVDETEV